MAFAGLIAVAAIGTAATAAEGMTQAGAARHAGNVANVREQQLAAQQRAAGQAQYNNVLGMGKNVAGQYTTEGQTAYNELMGAIPGLTGMFQPTIAAGQAASRLYQQDLPYLTGQYTPTQAQLAATPGYQFAHEQGLQATQNAAAAKGLGVSGNALSAAANYATGLAQQTYSQDAGIYQKGQSIAASNLLNGMNAGTTAANASGSLANQLRTGAVGSQTNYNQAAGQTLTDAQQTASADLLNMINSAAGTSSTGFNDAASGQMAYNNQMTNTMNSIDSMIGGAAGLYGQSFPHTPQSVQPIQSSYIPSIAPQNLYAATGIQQGPSAYGHASSLYGQSNMLMPGLY